MKFFFVLAALGIYASGFGVMFWLHTQLSRAFGMAGRNGFQFRHPERSGQYGGRS